MRKVFFLLLPAYLLFLLFSSLKSDGPMHVIITGGPGAGKTTILLNLESQGYDIVPEAATDIIKMSLANNIQAPWDHENFQRKVLDLQMLRQAKSLNSENKIVFYDRSPFDTNTYLKLKWPGCKDSAYVNETLKQLKSTEFFHTTIFLIENFGECLNNEVRHESMNEALMIQNAIEQDYIENGFRVVKVPPVGPDERVQFILDVLKSEQ